MLDPDCSTPLPLTYKFMTLHSLSTAHHLFSQTTKTGIEIKPYAYDKGLCPYHQLAPDPMPF